MFFDRIKTLGIAQVTYLIADAGEAALVDPCRDVDKYLTLLRENELTLRYVVETHRQEDFEMGGAALRRLTGAEIVAGSHELFDHADARLRDRETLQLGSLRLRALHTPGHTPESMCYAVFLADSADRAWGVFTGDALFMGDTGRTDLTDPGRTAENAGLLYDSLHNKVFPLGDQAQIFPAHGAGSACGGNVADRDYSTIGIERAANAAAVMTRDAFVSHKAHERIARPPYFTLMEEVNLKAGRPLDERPVSWLTPTVFQERRREGVVIDARAPEAFAGGHLPGSYSIWLTGLGRYGGWISYEAPIGLIVDGPAELIEARLALARIGHDNIMGALAKGFEAWRDAGLPIETSATIVPDQLQAANNQYTILDVREINEFEDEGHIPGAQHIFVGDLESRLGELGLRKDMPLVVTCSVGHRASLGVSILQRNGYSNVFNLLGGMTAWRKLGLALDRDGS
ncbi:MAG: MBL fold metallo-hydrolase [Nitrococcus sp.]|nr:MBL fold metallo-hydrolase [Nitrococcus sp.]